MREFLPFADAMSHPDVEKVARDMFDLDDAGQPEWLSRFLALTALAAFAEPEQDMGRGESSEYAASGCCVFYAPRTEDGLPAGCWEPWTVELTLGEGLSFHFEKVGDYTQSYNEDTGWRIPGAVSLPDVSNGDGTVTKSSVTPAGSPRPELSDMGWQAATLALLDSSIWRLTNAPEDVGK